MMNLAERDQQLIWHPYTQMQTAGLPVAIVKGKDALLYDAAGNTYIDAVSSWWVNLYGHCHPHIAASIAAQLQQLDHVIFAGFTHEPAVKLAENLQQVLPQNQSRFFYSDNGSTAVEVALKMAFQYWHNLQKPRNKIIAFRDSYHGDTFGAMSVSSRSAFTSPFSQYLFDVLFIDVPVPGKEEVTLNQLREIASRTDIAAFIYEPLVLGTAGMVMYTPEVLEELLHICRENQILTIADEVMTGFGRTGKYFASGYLSQHPDIMCFSKGLTGGVMALGLTTCSDTIYNAFLSTDKAKTFFHGHSYTANPIACTAALASLDLLKKPETMQNIERISSRHKTWREQIQNHKGCKAIRQTGTIIALELNTGATSYFNEVRDELYALALANGVLLRPLGNVIYIIPPYCITNQQLQQVYNVIAKMADMVAEKYG